MYLLDTNVVSELARLRPQRAVIAWFEATRGETLYISAVTIGELMRGVEMLRARDAARATAIENWIESIALDYPALLMDGAIFRRWAKLTVSSQDRLALDAMIAATADVHSLTVVTRNGRDFKALGVKTVNPFTFRG